MATCSSILAWRKPWTEEPGGLQPVGVTKKSDTTDLSDTNNVTVYIYNTNTFVDKFFYLTGEISGLYDRYVKYTAW